MGDRPVLAHLLRLLSGDEHFFLLALSQQEVRLLGGSRNTVEEIELTGAPTALEEVVRRDDPSPDVVARPLTGRGGRAVFYGHGGTATDVKRDELVSFLRSVAHGVQEVLRGQESPMVLVGLENLRVPYREANTYPHLLAHEVDRNADALTHAELHDLAWPVIEERLQAERAEVFERLAALRGTGRVSSDLETVARAASEGRVDTLFVQADPWSWDRASDDADPVVLLGTDERFGAAELVDATAVATLENGGRVYASAQTTVADSEVAAIFRY